MAPANSKANYKTYEAQARMVRAIVAAHPEVKWNYKDIAACYGSDMTEHALNHRFRQLRAQSVIIREGRQLGLDMKNLDDDLPKTQEKVDKKNIARYFGQSTADGIQFQFRGIKKDADILRKVESDGGNVANCLPISGGSTTTTPSKPIPSRSLASGGGSRSTTARKRTRVPAKTLVIKQTSSDEEETAAFSAGSDDEDNKNNVIVDWSERDEEETPSKKRPRTGTATGAVPRQKNGTPSRRAAAKANVTIAQAAAAAQFDTGESQAEEDQEAEQEAEHDEADNTPMAARVAMRAKVEPFAPAPVAAAPAPDFAPTASIFGPGSGVDRKPMRAFLDNSSYLGNNGLGDNFYLPMNGDSAFEGDGEI